MAQDALDSRGKEVTEARIEIVHAGGKVERWAFDLAADAPAEELALRAALVKEFIGIKADPADFTLTIAGTFAGPEFKLTEERSIARNRRPI